MSSATQRIVFSQLLHTLRPSLPWLRSDLRTLATKGILRGKVSGDEEPAGAVGASVHPRRHAERGEEGKEKFKIEMSILI